jgi:glycosyltransferase involved in cell wall biosynthesis
MPQTQKLPLPLSVAIIASNEEDNLPRCLESLGGIAQEIILFHNDCIDQTVEIAEQYNAQCFEHPWQGFCEQTKLAMSKTSQDWILYMDADEALSSKLRNSIIKLLSNNIPMDFDGFTCNRLSFFMGKWIKHGDWYPDTKLRLARADNVKCVGGKDHHRLVVDGKVQKLEGNLLHYSYPSLTTFVEKTIYFSDIYLQRQIDAGQRWKLHNAIVRPVWRFFRAYFLRLGFLDGFPGFFIATATAYMALVRHSRLYENEKLKSTEKDAGD